MMDMMFDPYEQFPHSVIFQAYTESTSDGMGGWTKGEWSNIEKAASAALVTPVSSREIAQAEQTRNPIEFEVYYPYRTDITGSMRILHDGEPLYIKSEPMDQGGQREIMMIECGRGETSDG
jgi:SPP1 family predicted phage head-tail adaptor